MKIICLIFYLLQQQIIMPVHWQFRAVAKGHQVYELHWTAILNPGWHIYSQQQPPDAIATPTSIQIDSIKGLSVIGKPREVGKLQKISMHSIGVSAWQYSEKVDFVEMVRLKNKEPSNIKGSLTFQTCRDNECLPPKTILFDIPVPK